MLQPSLRDHHYWFVRDFYNFIGRRTDTKANLFRLEKVDDTYKLNPINKKLILKIIKTLWYDVYTSLLKQDTKTEKVDFDGFDYFVERINDKKSIVIFTLPKPIAMVETYYIGVYFNKNDDFKNEIEKDPLSVLLVSNVDFRFITLEYSTNERSALCELHPNNAHSLLAFFENLNAKEFLELVKKVVL